MLVDLQDNPANTSSTPVQPFYVFKGVRTPFTDKPVVEKSFPFSDFLRCHFLDFWGASNWLKKSPVLAGCYTMFYIILAICFFVELFA